MKKFLAELIGTFSLVLIGCGTAVISGNAAVGINGAGLLGIAIAFGFAVVAMAYAIGGISGYHINPAVTIGVFVAGRMGTKDAIAYIIAQLIGATLGAGVLYLLAGGKALSQLWVFFVAPILGAALAALFWKYGFETANKES